MISDLQDCEVWSVSPSDVCLKCYHENNSAIWLSHLTCIRPSEHGDSDTITVVVSDSQDNQQLVPVRSADHLSRLDVSRIEMCRHDPSYCPKGDRCRFAHSKEELNYWRWERAKEILDNEFPLVMIQVYMYVCIIIRIWEESQGLEMTRLVHVYMGPSTCMYMHAYMNINCIHAHKKFSSLCTIV